MNEPTTVENTEAKPNCAPSDGSARDVTKSTLPSKDWHVLAEDLLARFPGVDRAELLKKMVAHCFFEMRYGNKREERAACDFLNELQHIAIALKPKVPNAPHEPRGTETVNNHKPQR